MCRAELEARFTAAGLSSEWARLVVEDLLLADREGHGSHGVIRVPEYLKAIEEGRIRPQAQPRVHGGRVLRLDGDWAPGAVVARQAVEAVRQEAETHGLALLSGSRVHHLGRLARLTEPLAQTGLVALAMVNGGGRFPRVAAHLGKKPVFGTNPISLAVPRDQHPPLVVDFSTAVVASGKIRELHQRGESLPTGWILDRRGEPSQNPEDYYDSGMLLPVGGHKGYGLSLMVEVLAGILSAAGSPATGYEVGNGLFLMACRVDCFPGGESYYTELERLLAVVAESGPQVQLPGDPERAPR